MIVDASRAGTETETGTGFPYNTSMDDSPIIDDSDAEPKPVETEAPALPELVYEPSAKGKEPWRGGSGCGTRAPLYGCIVGLALLIAALMVGTSMMRRTVWLNMDRGHRAVVQALPSDLPPAERVRTTGNLEHFRAVLEASKDPYPMMGEFMTRVRAILKDGRLTIDEVGGLNVYLERVIEESGIPLMQLGFRIFYPIPRCSECARKNSKFEIRNSKSSLA